SAAPARARVSLPTPHFDGVPRSQRCSVRPIPAPRALATYQQTLAAVLLRATSPRRSLDRKGRRHSRRRSDQKAQFREEPFLSPAADGQWQEGDFAPTALARVTPPALTLLRCHPRRSCHRNRSRGQRNTSADLKFERERN